MESSLYIEWHLTILLSTWVYFWHNMPEMHCIAWTYKIRDLANLVKIKIGIVIFGKSDALAAYIQFVLDTGIKAPLLKEWVSIPVYILWYHQANPVI